MKKIVAMLLCMMLVFTLVGCENNKNKKTGDTTVRINEKVYYNTKKVATVKPDESIIVNKELPLAGSTSGEKITAYAFVNDEELGNILVCLLDGEWYQFIETDRGGQP